MQKNSPLPLAGVRVLDIATMLAAPFCATILAEFGAEVIKVELPGKGDPFRRWGTMTEAGSSLSWLNDNRNKKSVTLDLRTEEGAELFKSLVRDCDIVTENFRPGTLEKWGLGYDTLKGINEDLILVRVSAYGQTGPYRDRPGFARIALAFSGVSYLTGEPDGPPLMPGLGVIGDYLAGIYAALGALLAYTSRSRHGGGGQSVDVSLYEPLFRMLDELAPAFAKYGVVRERMGVDHGSAVPHSHYETKDGKWVAIACSIDKMFVRLAHLMGRPDLLAPDRFATMRQRIAARAEVNAIVGGWVASLSQDQVMEKCLSAEVPVSRINSIADIFQDEQFASRQTLVDVEDPHAGKITIPNVLPRLSRTPGEIGSLGPRLGEHNMEIYRDRLGLSEEKIARLNSLNVI